MRFRISLALSCCVFVAGCGSATPSTDRSHPETAAAPSSSAATVEAKAPPSTCSEVSAPTSADTVGRVVLRGNARIPAGDVCAYIRTHAGKPFDEETLRRDVHDLWDSGLIEDIEVSSQIARTVRTVTFTVRERPLVHEWKIRGAKAVPEARIREILKGEIYDPVSLRTLVDSLRDEYFEAGYRSVVIDHRVSPGPKGQVEIAIDITEGPVTQVRRVVFEGISKSTEKDLVALMLTDNGHYNAVGGLYSADRLERDVLYMSAFYYDHGMLEVDVKPPKIDTSSDGRDLTITISISEGPVYRLGKVTCGGDFAGTAKECRDLAQLKQGEIFNRSEVVKSVDRIHDFQGMKMGRGTTVEPSTDLDRDKHVVSIAFLVARP